jgi:hypothetical protein
MRIARFVVLGLVVAASASAVALAVDKQGGVKQAAAEDGAEATVTVKGVLHATADGYAVGSRPVSFGPPWYAARSSLIKERLGTSVTVTGNADDKDGGLSVRTIDGITYRAKGRPPWAGGPKHAGNAAACKAKAKAAKVKAKEKKDADEKTEKADDASGGPPPWARAYGRRCKS